MDVEAHSFELRPCIAAALDLIAPRTMPARFDPAVKALIDVGWRARPGARP